MKKIKSFIIKALSADKDISIKRLLMVVVTLSLVVMFFINPKSINNDLLEALKNVDYFLIAGNVIGGLPGVKQLTQKLGGS